MRRVIQLQIDHTRSQDSSSDSGDNQNSKSNGHAYPDKAVAPQAPNGTASRDYAHPAGLVSGADTADSSEHRTTDALSTSEFESELDAEPSDGVGTVELTRMKLTPLKDVEIMPAGTRVAFRARVHHIRALGTSSFILRAQCKRAAHAACSDTQARRSCS